VEDPRQEELEEEEDSSANLYPIFEGVCTGFVAVKGNLEEKSSRG
jgi:hypothetical protein